MNATDDPKPQWLSVRPGEPCPVCGHDSWCRVSPDTNDDGKPNVVACRRVEADDERTYSDGTPHWLHKLGETDPALRGVGERQERPPLSDEEADLRDRVYRSLLTRLELHDDHRNDLRRRGLTEEQIEAGGYRSLPGEARSWRIQPLYRDGEFTRPELERIPGLRFRRGDLELTHPSGLLIPVRDAAGRVVALKVRRPFEEDGSKYVYLSTREKSSGSHAHVPSFEGDTTGIRVTEGELKADVATALSGVLTISVPGVGSWREVLPVLQKLDPAKVLVAFDADKAENEHVARAELELVAALLDAGYRVATEEWDLEVAKGIDDLLAAGHKPMLCERIAPPAAANATPDETTWAPIDLAAILAGGLERPETTMLARSDGVCLLYPGKVHAFYAEPEAGKTWLALVTSAERIEAGEHVLYVDFESDAVTILDRLRTLGVANETIIERFHYLRPHRGFHVAGRDLVPALVARYRPSLAVLDGVAEAMVLDDLDENVNRDSAKFFAGLPTLLEREGVTVLLLDHVTKSKEGRGRWGRGAGHKLGAITGASFTLAVGTPFGRGITGTGKLHVAKDRLGALGPHTVAGMSRLVAEVEVASDGATVTVTLKRPSEEFRPTVLMERVSRTLEQAPEPLSQVKVLEMTTGQKEAKLQALHLLVAEGYVERFAGARNALLHRSIKAYRQDDQDQDQDEEGGF